MQAVRVQQFSELLQWFARTRTDGMVHGSAVTDATPEERRTFFDRTPEALSIGTLEYVLDIAHQELDGDTVRARELTTFVLEYVDRVTVPGPSTVPLLLFRARAYKEHANALRSKGELRDALRAVGTAVEILSRNGACRPELANVRMLQATIQHQLGDKAGALRIIAESANEFRLERDTLRYVQARVLEGVFHFEQDPRRAAEIWESLLDDAAGLSDTRELARICSNLWIAAVKLKDPDGAHRYYRRAAELYDENGMHAEKPRLRWGYARALAQQGLYDAALREYAQVRADLFRQEMVTQDAEAALEVMEIYHNIGRRAEAQALALELYDTFVRAGKEPKAQAALSFLQQRAAENDIRPPDIRAVREYLQELPLRPDAEFLPPRS